MNKAVLVVVCLYSLSASYGWAQSRVVEQTWSCTDQQIAEHGRGPECRIARKEYGANQARTLFLQMSISPKATTSSADMVLLGCRLASEYPNEKSIDALIFDNEKAAKNLALYATDQADWGEYVWHLRARYRLDKTTRQQYVDWLLPEVNPKESSALYVLTQYHISIPIQP